MPSPVRFSPSHVVTEGRVPSLHGALEEWLLDRRAIKNLSPVTVTWYREHTRTLLDVVGTDQPVTAASYEHVRRILADTRARGCSDSTVHADFRAIRAFTRWCARQGWEIDRRLLVMEAPVIGGEETVEIYRADQVAALQRHFKPSLRDTLIIGLLLGTGIRLKEMIALDITDRHGEQIEVRWQTAKGRRTRWCPLSLRLQRDWVRYVERTRPSTAGQLLRGRTGAPLSHGGVQTLLHRAGKATGIHCHAHKFRHTFATWYIRRHIEAGERYDPERLRLILGHTSYALFPRYLHLAQSDVVKGWERVAPY